MRVGQIGKMNCISGKKQQTNNSVAFQTNCLAGMNSDKFSFGNSSNYSMKEFNTSWPYDFKIASDLLREQRITPESLNIIKSRMENHFFGILDLIKNNKEGKSSTIFLNEALLTSNFLYQDASVANGEAPSSVYKLDKKLASLDKTFHFSADFCVKNRKKFRFNTNNPTFKMISNMDPKHPVGINFAIYFLNGNLDKFTIGDSFEDNFDEGLDYGAEDKSKFAQSELVEGEEKYNPLDEADEFFKDELKLVEDNKKYNPVDEAEEFFKSELRLADENKKASKNLAITKLYGGKNLFEVNEGLDSLVKTNAISDIKEFILKIISPSSKYKKSENVNLASVFYDIGAKLLKHGKSGALQDFIEDEDIPAVAKVFLDGARVGFKR